MHIPLDQAQGSRHRGHVSLERAGVGTPRLHDPSLRPVVGRKVTIPGVATAEYEAKENAGRSWIGTLMVVRSAKAWLPAVTRRLTQ
jgi:hypothetical protein